MDRQRKADLMLVLATSFWGISTCLTAICLTELSPLTLNAFRFLTGFLVLGIVFCKRLVRASRKTLRYSFFTGLAIVVVYLGATYGVLYTSVSNAGFIGALAVLFTPIFEFLLYRKKPARKFLLSLCVCMIGIALLTLNETLKPALGDILCLLVPIFYAIDLILTEKAVADPQVEPVALGVWKLGVVALVMLLGALLFEQPKFPRSPTVWASVLFLGLFCSGICFIIQSVEQQYTTASRAGLIFTLEPVFSAVFAFFLLSERLNARGYLGAALMLLSLVIMEIDFSALVSKKRKKEESGHDDL